MTKIERHDFYRVTEELENELLETGEDVCASTGVVEFGKLRWAMTFKKKRLEKVAFLVS